MKTRIVIFASGSGTNAENIAHYLSDHSSIKVALIISNKADAGVKTRAERLNIPFACIPKSEFEAENRVLQLLNSYEIEFIVLAGFLIKIPAYLIAAFPHAIINIHPALLPKFGGAGMYGNKVHEAVKAANETESGITIHYVDEEYDSGSTIFQVSCSIVPEDTPEDIAGKVHELEYKHYPLVIEQLLTDRRINPV